MIFYGIKIVSELFLSYCDVRTLSVPIWAILIWGYSVLFLSWPGDWVSGFCAVLAMILCQAVEVYSSKEYLGLADKIIFPVVALQFPVDVIGMLFILTGVCAFVLAVIWRSVFKTNRFPMMPAIFCAQYLMLVL